MNKLLRFSLMTMLALFGMGNAMADDVVFDFTDASAISSYGATAPTENGGFVEVSSLSYGGVTITADNGGATNTVRLYKSSPQAGGEGTITLRIYKGNSLTFSSSQAIKSITLTGNNTANFSASTGTIEGGNWTGSASSVTLSYNEGSGTIQIRTATIGFTAVDPGTPDPVVTTGSGTLDDPYTSADAIAVASALASGAKTDNNVYVKGKISSIKYTFNEEHGTATFFISDDGTTENQFQCYQVLYLENKDWKDGNSQIEVGDDVIICGKLMNFQGNTPETSNREAYIYSLNGNTQNEISVGPVTFIGDGSQGNPYLVSDLRQMTSDNYTEDKVWVKGIIIGTAKSKTALNEEDAVTNIAIAVSDSDTEFIPVELKSGTNFRQDINLVDHPENKGKEILIHGQITAYFSTTGVKNLDEAILDGTTITGITEISADTDVNAPAYNVAGQRVNNNYKGVVVKNGKKFIK